MKTKQIEISSQGENTKIAQYHHSLLKRGFDITISLSALLLLFPTLLLISVILWLVSGRPIFYRQKRRGRGTSTFWLVKFRTMEVGADKMKKAMMPMNEADGPVFKIRQDPRYVGIGRWLSWLGLDELPQLWNVLTGSMSLVGPRPLPLDEAVRVPARYQGRHVIRPGLTSRWVFEGSHQMSFREWMQRDCRYVEEATFMEDWTIILRTGKMIGKSLFYFITRQEDKLK